MNNLHLALAILGAVVLAAVVAHGAWTSRRNRPKQADAEPKQAGTVDPALETGIGQERREPVLEGGAETADGFGSLPAPRREAERR